jgi:hypothetical protein
MAELLRERLYYIVNLLFSDKDGLVLFVHPCL